MKWERRHVRFKFSNCLFLIAVLMVQMGSASPMIAKVLTPDGGLESFGEEKDVRTPLGSLYKVFIFAYLSEQRVAENVYTCTGQNPEEIFCCDPGGQIGREAALAKSCSPYFQFSRLGVDEKGWRKFWTRYASSTFQIPNWLTNFKSLRPETVVSAHAVLDLLRNIRLSFKSFPVLERAMMGTVIYGTARNSLKTWGSTLKVKTYTWRDEHTIDRIDEQGFTGGFAGWLADGSSIWVSREGYGRDAFQSELNKIVEAHSQSIDKTCVVVQYFDQYPILSVHPEQRRLSGPTQIQFKNGHKISFNGDGSLELRRVKNEIKISARVSTQEYIGRVLQREVQSTPLEAARAFALAIRTFLFQNSHMQDGCRNIADSSHLQRVSPEPASAENIKIARWSDGLVIGKIPSLRYHSTQSSTNRMSWSEAKSLAKSGYSMGEIIKSFYPSSQIEYGEATELVCRTNLNSERWVAKQFQHWRPRLLTEPGFEWPDHLKICESRPDDSQSNRVFSILEAQEIYSPSVRTIQDETSMIHEFLHLGFRNHPQGQNEQFIENFALSLQGER